MTPAEFRARLRLISREMIQAAIRQQLVAHPHLWPELAPLLSNRAGTKSGRGEVIPLHGRSR